VYGIFLLHSLSPFAVVFDPLGCKNLAHYR
jgi:hypothetical protein